MPKTLPFMKIANKNFKIPLIKYQKIKYPEVMLTKVFKHSILNIIRN